MRTILSCLVASLFVFTSAFAADPLPRATPQSVGLSPERLARVGEVLRAEIDKDAGTKMTTDAIFSIASMTKPML